MVSWIVSTAPEHGVIPGHTFNGLQSSYDNQDRNSNIQQLDKLIARSVVIIIITLTHFD